MLKENCIAKPVQMGDITVIKWVSEEVIVSKLSDRYKVSQDAITYRLMNLSTITVQFINACKFRG